MSPTASRNTSIVALMAVFGLAICFIIVGAISVEYQKALNIANKPYLAAALSIWAVEARHASVAGLLVKPTSKNISPDGGAFDETATAAEILKAVEGTGFLA